MQSYFSRLLSSELTIRTPWWPIVVKWGALAMLLSFVLAAGILVTSLRHQTTGVFAIVWQDALISGILAFVGLFLHESGHAIAGRFTGREVLRVQFGLAGGAVTSGDTTPLRRVTSLAAGPLAEISFGLALLCSFGVNLENPFSVAGIISIINGVGNLLPFHWSTDGYKIILFGKLALLGNPNLPCAPVGPCPACEGKISERDLQLV